jgi:hypothetical protein
MTAGELGLIFLKKKSQIPSNSLKFPQIPSNSLKFPQIPSNSLNGPDLREFEKKIK